jgi:hypothetical protein
MRLFGLLITSIFFFLMSGCQPKINDKRSLNKFISSEGNGLISKKEVGSIDVTMRYLPWQLLASRSKTKENQKDSVVEQLKKSCFFLLSFSQDNKELLRQLDFDTYSELVSVLSFRMKEKINAVTNTKTIEAKDCSFQQTYGHSGANELLIVFDSKEIREANYLEVTVDEFGLNLGDLVFKFNTDNINNLYMLDYKNL